MSLFDVLRYQISIPPEPGELEALPTELFKHWIDEHTIDWCRVKEGTRYSVTYVSDWMRNAAGLGAGAEVKADLLQLRKLIKEWEE